MNRSLLPCRVGERKALPFEDYPVEQTLHNMNRYIIEQTGNPNFIASLSHKKCIVAASFNRQHYGHCIIEAIPNQIKRISSSLLRIYIVLQKIPANWV